MSDRDDRRPSDGRPFYCALCGAGWGEFLACEEPDCRLESEYAAKRRQRESKRSAPEAPRS